jgi:hypothetical protein
VGTFAAYAAQPAPTGSPAGAAIAELTAEVADEATDDAFSVADEAASLVADEQPERAMAVTAAKPAAVSTERWNII